VQPAHLPGPLPSAPSQPSYGTPHLTTPASLTAGAVSPHWLPTPTRSYAGFWLRFLAHLIDSVIVGGVLICLLIPLAMATGVGAGLHRLEPGEPPNPAMVMAFIGSLWIFILAAVAGSWLYYAYCESCEWQATVGKKVLNLVVTDLNGARISFGRASGRYFAKIVTSMIPCGIGYMLAGFTEKKQALHDMIASCLVLRS
jgi:uncharacterized RDD family membrane protein YckC